MIGIWQLVLIFAIVLLLFGAGRVSKIMNELGSGIRSFKNGLEGKENNSNKNANKKKSNITINKKAEKNVLKTNKNKTNKSKIGEKNIGSKSTNHKNKITKSKKK